MASGDVARLADAVRAGDLAQVQAMLQARPELVHMDMSESNEHRAIHYAVLGRMPRMVRLLMAFGSDARKGIYPFREPTQALTLATERGYDEIVAIIREEEAKRTIAAEEAESETPPTATEAAVISGDLAWLRARHAEGKLTAEDGALTAAVEHNRPDVLRLLLDLGLDPDERVRLANLEEIVYSAGSPLWQSAARGHAGMAELLLRRGANPNVHVYCSGSSVHGAYSHQQWNLLPLLRRYGGVVGADTAAIYRETELARQLLAADPARAEELLRFGSMGGDPEIVRMALDRIDWPADDPRWFGMLGQPLSFWHHIPWLAAGNKALDRRTYLDCFHLLLARCGPHLRGQWGRTMLHEVAALRDYVTEDEGAPFAAALLQAGARLDVRDEMLRSTPLAWACRWGRIEVVKLLLQAGADPVEADAEPWATPLAWAVKRGHHHIAALLG